MDIIKLASKLEYCNVDFKLNEESLNFPVLSLKIISNKFKFFYRENFIERTKFHKKYKTFLEITANKKSKLSIFKIEIDEMLSCNYRIDENIMYTDVSKIDEDQMIVFINKFQK